MIENLIKRFRELEERLADHLSSGEEERVQQIDSEITEVLSAIVQHTVSSPDESRKKFDFLLEQLCFGIEISPTKELLIKQISELFEDSVSSSGR